MTSSNHSPTSSRLRLFIIAVLIVGLAFRLYGVQFGLPALNDPDELMFELGGTKMLLDRTLNPAWFGHPATTTMYLLAVINGSVFFGGWFFGVFPDTAAFADAIYQNPSLLILPGRLAMVAFAIWSIWLTYKLAKTLFDWRVGISAAALISLSSLHIAYSQVIRSDIMGCTFMLLCLLAVTRIGNTNQWRDYALAAFWLALAVASKWPFALLGFSVAAVAFTHFIAQRATLAFTCWRLILFTLLSIVILILISPFLVLDYPTVIRNLGGEAQTQHVGATAGTFWQNIWWYISNPLYSAFGPLALALSIAGLPLIAKSALARAVLFPTAITFVITICLQGIRWERWILPLLPILAISAGVAAFAVIDRVTKHRTTSQRYLMLLLAIFSLLPPLFQSAASARMRVNDTRQLAAQWARGHIPDGSSVLIEHFAFDLADKDWAILFPLGDAGCVNAQAMIEGKIDYSIIDKARGSRSNVDYGTMAPEMRKDCVPDYAILSQYDRYKAERSNFPNEFEAYSYLLDRGSIIASFEPKTGETGGPVIRIIKISDQMALTD